MKLNHFDFNLRTETTLGQIWETVRQWILNSPYSKFEKVPRKLPTKICEGEAVWEADGDKVSLSRAGEGMTITSERIRRGLKWKTILKFTRLKRQVKSAAEIHIEGSIPEDDQEVKAPRIVKQLLRVYGLNAEVKKKGEGQEQMVNLQAPDMADREDCKRYLREAYQFLREHYVTKIHTETQAINYILTEAKKGGAYFAMCKKCREIKEAYNWERSTFANYCKTTAAKPKGLKRAAKGRAKKRQVTRDLKRK